MLAIVGALLLGAAIFYVVYTTKKATELMEAEERFNLDWDNSENKKAFRAPIYLSFTKTLLKGAYLEMALGFFKPHHVETWKKKLSSAGLTKYIQPEQFLASRFWFALIVGTFTFLFYLFAEEPPPAWLPIATTLAAFYLPVLDINGRITARQQQIRLAMPYVVDLLTLSTEAGLDFMGSISKVVDRAPPSAFIDELSIVLKDIQLGRTRAEALKEMSERVDMPEMRGFVATLVSAESMGTSIGTVLRAQSDTMRTERLVRAEKAGAQASQKILIPLVFFILPAVMLMIFGPVVLGMMGAK